MERIGRYEVIRELGRGGMATVYLCRDTRLGRQVAVKVLPRHVAHDESFNQRFEREARVLARIEHEAIVPIHDIGEDDGTPFLVMPYMAGGSLFDRLREGRLDDDETLRVLDRVAAALDAARAQHVIHRDLKPANILFDASGRAFVADFGIAHLGDATHSITGNALIGTPAYMSPEQAEGAEVLTAASDVYSLGVVAFEMVTGRPPFTAGSPFALARQHIQDAPPPASARRADLGSAVDRALAAALAKEPASRPTTAGAFVAALRSALAEGDAAVLPDAPTRLVDSGGLPATRVEAAPIVTAPTLVAPEADTEPTVAAPTELSTPPRRRRRWPVVVVLGAGTAVAAVVIAVVAIVLATGSDSKAAEASPDLLNALSYAQDGDERVTGYDVALIRPNSAAFADSLTESYAATLGVSRDAIRAFADFEGYAVLVGEFDAASIERHLRDNGFEASDHGFVGEAPADGVTRSLRVEVLGPGRVAISLPEEPSRAPGALPSWLQAEVERGPFPMHSIEVDRCGAVGQCRVGDTEDAQVRFEQYASVAEIRGAGPGHLTYHITERIKLHPAEDGEAAREKLGRNDDGAKTLRATLAGREVTISAVYDIDEPAATPTTSATPARTPAATASATATPSRTPTASPTGTATPTPTATPTSTPTIIPSPTPSKTSPPQAAAPLYRVNSFVPTGNTPTSQWRVGVFVGVYQGGDPAAVPASLTFQLVRGGSIVSGEAPVNLTAQTGTFSWAASVGTILPSPPGSGPGEIRVFAGAILLASATVQCFEVSDPRCQQ